MKNLTISTLVTSCLFLMWTAFAPSGNTKLRGMEESWEAKVSPQLMTKALRGEDLNFLVVLENQADTRGAKNYKTKEDRANFVFQKLKSHATAQQKNIRQLLNSTQSIFQPFHIINALQVKGDFQLLRAVAQLPEVQNLTDNSAVLLQSPVEEIYTTSRGPNAIEWGIDMIGADEVWNMGIRGEGAIVGGQDTGYDWTHPALQPKYRGYSKTSTDHNYNWHDAIHEYNPMHSTEDNPCGLDTQVPCDDNNHGTHTMGTMVGEHDGNQIGVAPEAQWMACRNMERGYGTPSTYIECFEWFMAPTDLNNENPDVSKAPHVIANSWSCPPVEGCDASNWNVMQLVVENLKASGVVVVVSAGNSGGNGCGSVSAPAAMFEASFSVGATNSDDNIAGFSSRGAVTVDGSGILKPNVSAPGVAVRSTIRNGGYASFSGTSMAGPHTAGLVALMVSANPRLAGQVEAIEDIIEQTAVPKTDPVDCGGVSSQEIPNNIYGYGRINALAAVNAALEYVPSLDGDFSIKIFPNPTEGLAAVEIDNWIGELEFDLFDMAGRLIQSYQWDILKYQVEQIDLTAFPAGVYFYKIKNGDNEQSGKIMKQ